MALGYSGLNNRGNYSPFYRPQPTNYTPEAAYPRAVEQQAGDYDDIMDRYRAQLGANRARGAAQATYGETPQFHSAFGSASNLASTGGISGTEEADMRARGVSPIRAAYQNAQRNMERQARLGGGRSANYNAAASRMAREQGEAMAAGLTNVNAGIAETRQRGRIAGTGNMTTMGEGSSTRMNEVGMFNAREQNRQNEVDANLLGGMTNLYGTTPALVNTFGNQVQNNQELAARYPRRQRRTLPGMGGGFTGNYGGAFGR